MINMSKTTIPFCAYLSSNFNLKLVLGNKDTNDTNWNLTEIENISKGHKLYIFTTSLMYGLSGITAPILDT